MYIARRILQMWDVTDNKHGQVTLKLRPISVHACMCAHVSVWLLSVCWWWKACGVGWLWTQHCLLFITCWQWWPRFTYRRCGRWVFWVKGLYLFLWHTSHLHSQEHGLEHELKCKRQSVDTCTACTTGFSLLFNWMAWHIYWAGVAVMKEFWSLQVCISKRGMYKISSYTL